MTSGCSECVRKTEAIEQMGKALDKAVGTLKDLEAARTGDAREIASLKARLTKQLTEGSVGEDIKRVYDYWVRCKGMSRDDPNSKLGTKRMTAVRGRLTEGFTVEQLLTAVQAAVAYPYWVGPGERAAFPKRKGDKKHDDLAYICRDETTVARFCELAENPPQGEKPTPIKKPAFTPIDAVIYALTDRFGNDAVLPDMEDGRVVGYLSVCPVVGGSHMTMRFFDEGQGVRFQCAHEGCDRDRLAAAVDDLMSVRRAA